MANDRRNGAVQVTSQLNYYTITLPSEKIHSEKQNNFVIYLFILAKVAAKWQLLILLFRKNEGDNKSQICDFSRYFSRKGKHLVANATVLVAISSPDFVKLSTVPTIVIAHMFCISRDTQISYRWCLSIQGTGGSVG